MRTVIRSSLLVLAATVGLIAAQEPSEAQHQDPKERLEELIQKAKELESFHAVYRISSPTKGGSDVRICYSKPDQFAFRAKGDDGETLECVILGTTMQMLARSPDGKGMFAVVNCLPVPANAVDRVFDAVRERFPGAGVQDPADALGPHISFSVEKDKEGEPLLGYEFSNGFGGDEVVEWLSYLQKHGTLVEESATTFVFEGEYQSTFVLQKTTGFLESVRVPCAGGEKTLQLVDLELDQPIEADEFEATEADPDFDDQSAALEDRQYWCEVQWMKGAVAWAIVELVEQEKLEWDDEARAKARDVFGVHHAAILEVTLSDWTARKRSWIGEFCTWFQSSRAQAGDDSEGLSELDQAAAKAEQRFRESIDKSREIYRTCAGAPLPVKDTGPWKEISQIDAEAVEEAFTQQVERRLIDEFEKQISLAREGKLPDPSGGKIERPASR